VNVLAPTAEEVVTSLAAAEVRSYKQLPVNLYQINTKFRDEFRPRFGALRSREFIMKDAYSFDLTVESLDASYRKMYDAYCRIFTRSGLRYVTVQADSGGMGGTDTEEFMVISEAGEDVLVSTADGSYAANVEKAPVDPPAEDPTGADARRSANAIEEVHTPGAGGIEAVCEVLGTQPGEMIKTLIYWRSDPEVVSKLSALQGRLDAEAATLAREQRELESLDKAASENTISGETREQADDARAAAEVRRQRLNALREELCAEYGKLDVVVCLVRGDHEANELKIASVLGHDVELADETTIERLTGAAVGFAGPMGLVDKGVRLVIDPWVSRAPTVPTTTSATSCPDGTSRWTARA
jgi:prolyl-tRNA synthetase